MLHPDGYVEMKDRSKDIIISGGENISSLEVEEALYKHPGGARSGGGGAARREMGRDALRLRHAEARRRADGRGHHRLLPGDLAHFMVPQPVIFGPLPKTSTGKIQKFVLREQAKTLKD